MRAVSTVTDRRYKFPAYVANCFRHSARETFPRALAESDYNKFPFTRHLPCGQRLQQEIFQFRFRRIRHDDGNDNFCSFFITAWQTENETFANLWMREQRAFDGFRRNLASSHIDFDRPIVRARKPNQLSIPPNRSSEKFHHPVNLISPANMFRNSTAPDNQTTIVI